MRSDHKVHQDVEDAAHVDRLARLARDRLAQLEDAKELQQLEAARASEVPREGADRVRPEPADADAGGRAADVAAGNRARRGDELVRLLDVVRRPEVEQAVDDEEAVDDIVDDSALHVKLLRERWVGGG